MPPRFRKLQAGTDAFFGNIEYVIEFSKSIRTQEEHDEYKNSVTEDEQADHDEEDDEVHDEEHGDNGRDNNGNDGEERDDVHVEDQDLSRNSLGHFRVLHNSDDFEEI